MFNWLILLLGGTPKDHVPYVKEQWKMVKTHAVPLKLTSTDVSTRKLIDTKEGKFFYHLFESNKGKRKVEVGCTLEQDEDKLEELKLKWEDYHEIIFPWLQGRFDANIPSYADIDMIEVQEKLSA